MFETMTLCCVLLILAAVVTPSFCQLPNCHIMQCNGPKFTRSVCCDGFICVSNGHFGSPGMLMCVDKSEHLKVKSLGDILSQRRPYGLPMTQNNPNIMNQQPMLPNHFANLHQPQNPMKGQVHLPGLQNTVPQHPNVFTSSVAKNFPGGGFQNYLGTMNYLPQDDRPNMHDLRMNTFHSNAFHNHQNNQGSAGVLLNNNAVNLGTQHLPHNTFQQNYHIGNYVPPINGGSGFNNGQFIQPPNQIPIQVGFRSKSKPEGTDQKESQTNSTQTEKSGVGNNKATAEYRPSNNYSDLSNSISQQPLIKKLPKVMLRSNTGPDPKSNNPKTLTAADSSHYNPDDSLTEKEGKSKPETDKLITNKS